MIRCVMLAIAALLACAPPAADDDPGGDAGSGIHDAGTPVDADDVPDDAGFDVGAQDAGPGSDAGMEVPPDFAPAATNVPAGALCPGDDYFDQGGDPVDPPCAIEIDNGIAVETPATGPLRIVEWNVRFGVDSERVAAELSGNPALAADVLLLSEVARGDARSNPVGINQARELALALGMNYAFVVEWDHRYVEGYAEPRGEHGVALLARFPIGELTPIRHTPAHDWWADERRIGGRITLGATLLVGGRLVRVYSSHLCTRPTLPDDGPRAVQGAEIRADADRSGRPEIQIVGGDLNTWTCNPAQGDCAAAPRSELVIEELLGDGWLDGTAGFTGYTQLGSGFFPQRLDWIFYRGVDAVPGGRVDVAGSDHLPITTVIDLDAP